MRRSIFRAWVAGLLGTIALALVAYSIYPIVAGGVPLDLAAMLGEPLGEDWTLGLAALFVLGVLVAPTTYVVLLRNLPPGVEPLRGMAWGSLLWFVAQLCRDGARLSRWVGGLPVALGLLFGLLIYGAMFGVAMKDLSRERRTGTLIGPTRV